MDCHWLWIRVERLFVCADTAPAEASTIAAITAAVILPIILNLRFLLNPNQVVPGDNMKPYGGLASAEERAKIIAFLEANEGG